MEKERGNEGGWANPIIIIIIESSSLFFLPLLMIICSIGPILLHACRPLDSIPSLSKIIY